MNFATDVCYNLTIKKKRRSFGTTVSTREEIEMKCILKGCNCKNCIVNNYYRTGGRRRISGLQAFCGKYIWWGRT